MKEIIEICGIALITAVCALGLKKYAPETSVLLAITGGAFILIRVLSRVSPIIEQISSLASNGEYAEILVKTLGICVICQFVSETCKDAGQGALASKVEFSSRVAIIITAMPLFRNILNTAMELMK